MPTNGSLSVCITFDFDSICGFGTLPHAAPTPISRGEFGARVGVPRLLDLLGREGVKAAFFTPGHTIDTFPELCQRIVAEGHEMGHHGYFHETPFGLEEPEERAVLEKGIEAMDRHLDGYRPRGYRAPSWDLSPSSVGLLVEYGFEYDSSMMAQDFEPYWCRSGDNLSRDRGFEFGPEVDLVEVPVSWSLDDAVQLEFVMLTPSMLIPGASSPRELEERWLADLEFCAEEVPDGVYTITFHPECIARGARIRTVERLIARARELDANFVTPGEVARSWATRQAR